jgi:hypothetical protein
MNLKRPVKGLATGAVVILGLLALLPLRAAGPEPEARYGIGSWTADTLGNHRAVVRVTAKASAAWVHLAWRRRDLAPEQKNIIIIDAAPD